MTGRALVAVVCGASMGLGAAATVGAAAPGSLSAATIAPTRYYVALGASESVGFQPVPGKRRGARTDDGYANDLLSLERTRWPGLRLVQFGCPGITVQRSIFGKSACRYPRGSELATAVHFLGAHRRQVALVTVDLGFNDLVPCMHPRGVGARCMAHALAAISKGIPLILRRVHSVTSSSTLVVGIEHDDPYLALARRGAWQFAVASAAALGEMNATLERAYRRGGAVIARVPDSAIHVARMLRRDTTFRLASVGSRRSATPAWAHDRSFRRELVQVCRATWMCTLHNIHPTDTGYHGIARSIAHAIGGALGP